MWYEVAAFDGNKKIRVSETGECTVSFTKFHYAL